MGDERKNKPYSQKRSLKGVPIGVEKVLFEAAGDPAFREALLADREAALLARGLKLRDSELAMLLAIPDEQLSAAIDGTNTSPANVQRRKFMRVVAASAMTIASAEALSCSSTTETGSRPNDPEDGGPEAGPDMTGSRPDWPDAATDAKDAPAPDGLENDGPENDGPDDGTADVDLEPKPAGIRPDGWQED